MPGHKVTLIGNDSEKPFDTKTEAKAFLRDILARHRNNETIRPEDAQWLPSLLERHPEAHQKIGCGIKRFFKRESGKGTDCFWIERQDGSETDFSFITCVDAKGKSLFQEFAEACREAVQPQLAEAKQEHFRKFGNADGKVPCEITGEMVAHYESHLDHKQPMTFQVIVTTFIAANKIELHRDMLSAPADVQFATTFVDHDLGKRFVEFHSSVAHLRIVAKKENLRLGGSTRLTKPKRPVALKQERL